METKPALKRALLTRRDMLATVVLGAVTLALGSPATSFADSAANMGSSPLVTLGGVTFAPPSTWSVDLSVQTDTHISWTVSSPDGGSLLGQVILDCNNRAEEYAGLGFDELAGTLVATFTPQSDTRAVWHPVRDDMSSIMCAVRYAQASYQNSGLAVGAVYIGAPPVNHLFVMSILAHASVADTVLAEAKQVWDTANWAGAWADDLAQSKAAMLEDTHARYTEKPWYNPHWTVSDFTCILNTANPEAPYLDHMRTQFATPEGITTWEDAITQITLFPYPIAEGYDLWCMKRSDSSGDNYLRSTVEIEGIGIVDIAYYEGY